MQENQYRNHTPYKNFLKNEEEIRLLISQGIKPKAVADTFQIPYRTLYSYLKLHGIEILSRGCSIVKNETFFDEIDSEEKAYILGYILADGSIELCPKKKKDGEIYAYSSRIGLLVSVDDKEAIELIHKNVCPNNTIKEFHCTKGAKNRKPQLSLRFTSKNMVNKLMNKYNIKPRKTYDETFMFPFETIPEHLIRHFIRGFFDGDGWISKEGSLGFVSTSTNFLNQIQNILEKYLTLSKFSLRSVKSKNMYFHQLLFCSYSPFAGVINYREKKRIRKEFLEQVYNYLYKDSTCFLSRKKDKFIEQINKRTSEKGNI